MFGLPVIDVLVIFLYFAVMIGIGAWSSRRIKNKEDYFLAGRRFGKLIQTFAAFGQATSADNAVSTTTTTFNNGIAGMWSSMLYLFATPLYWVATHWPRRMRILTLGDYFEERFDSKALGAVYSVIGSIGMMALIAVGFSAMTKTIVAIIPKDAAVYTAADLAAYNAAFEKERIRAETVGRPPAVLTYEQLAERQALSAMDPATLSAEQGARRLFLDSMQPAASISHISRNVLIWAVCLVVLLYAVVGGLEAAFITDMIQGMFIILLSLILIPFAWARINTIFGGSGMVDALHTVHLKLPDSFFKIFGAPHTPDFTWYYILSLSFMAAITVMTQPNGAVLAGSAKDELSNRIGVVVGNFIKRFCIIFWAVFGLAAIVLYEGKVVDSDLIWGYATLDLLGPLKLGLVGLMIACLMAALMSTVDCLMLTCSSLLTHNLYTPLFPNKSPIHYVWAGRVFGALVVVGGAWIALQFERVLEILKFLWEINVFIAPAYWLGLKWRRANNAAAWVSIVTGALLFLIVPALAPKFSALTHSETYLRTNDAAPIAVAETAREFDVERRRQAIAQWDKLDLIGEAAGARPEALAVGQQYEHTYTFARRSIFWQKGFGVDDEGQPVGMGFFNVELWILEKCGLDLVSYPYALNQSLRILFRTLLPFVIFILIALITRPDPEDVLNRFFAKMRTRVLPDPEADAREVRLSLADPRRLDHLLVFPGSQWEIYKWNKEDWVGFILSLGGVGVVLLVIYVLVSIGG